MRVLAWWIWLIVAFGIGIIELATVTFVLLWMAIAALVTAVLSLAITGVWAQFFIFAIISVGLYFATRPLAQRWRNKRRYPASRMEGMVGERALVVKGAQPGRLATVRVNGELWSAQSTVSLEPGHWVVIVRAESSVLFVQPMDAPDMSRTSGTP